MAALSDGQKIRGTYEVERFLGEGAFAEVYRVKHRFLGRQAMKVFKQVGMTAAETEAALGEAILLSRLGHPNIVRVFDADTFEAGGDPRGYFTMEYVAGGSLDQYWRSHGQRLIPVETTVDVMRQVCRGLAIAHRESPPIVHRDIKPQNILVGYDGAGLRIRVSDFGLAKGVNPLTLMATARGTLCFKAPEAVLDRNFDSLAGDIWALGCTLYLLLTDRFPYGGANSDELAPDRIAKGPLIPPSRLNVDADAALDDIVARALAVTANDRFSDAAEMLTALEEWSPSSKSGPTQSREQRADSSSSKGLPGNESSARMKLTTALELARDPSRLPEAADVLEDALNDLPGMRDEYEYYLKLWRRGIAL